MTFSTVYPLEAADETGTRLASRPVEVSGAAMLSNRLAFAALAVACIGAAAGGGYLATRQNAVPAPVAAQAQPQPIASAPAPAAQPVQETEGVVGDTAAKPAAAAPAAKPAPQKRKEPAPRRPSARETRTSPHGAARRDPAPLASSQPPIVAGSPPVHPPPCAPRRSGRKRFTVTAKRRATAAPRRLAARRSAARSSARFSAARGAPRSARPPALAVARQPYWPAIAMRRRFRPERR